MKSIGRILFFTYMVMPIAFSVESLISKEILWNLVVAWVLGGVPGLFIFIVGIWSKLTPPKGPHEIVVMNPGTSTPKSILRVRLRNPATDALLKYGSTIEIALGVILFLPPLVAALIILLR